MNVKTFDYDLDTGFAWILVELGEDLATIQCCIEAGKKQIDMVNSGFDEGICRDVNQRAVKYWGSNRCFNTLIRHAKKNGFEII